MSTQSDRQALRVLYVTHPDTASDLAALSGLTAAEPGLDASSVQGVAEAVARVRTAGPYQALFISAGVPHNETLALISSLRRDRSPIAIVVLVHDHDRQFLVPAITAGADDVLVVRESGLSGLDETLRRIRHSRHVQPAEDGPRLRVLYAGADGLAWSVLSEIRFLELDRTNAIRNGAMSLVMDTPDSQGEPCDVLIVDELPGEAHTLEVVKWVKSRMPELPVIVLTPPNGADVGGAALDMGADEVVSKAGTYRRRLVATLHRLFLRQLSAEKEPDSAATLVQPPDDRGHEEARARLEQALADATTRIDELRRQYEDLSEAQGFERAMRDRDRADLASLRQSLKDERERRIVLEDTLRRTEDRSREQVEALEAEGHAARRRFERQLEAAADRLHAIANETQVLQSRLASELAAQAAERDRLVEQGLFGYAVLRQDGTLVRCSQSFANMFGYPSADDAVNVSSDGAFRGLPDHESIVTALRADAPIGRVESTARRADGRPFRVLTSAGWLRQGADETPLVERLVVDISDRSEVEAQLRLARRLEAAGRLAAEMSPAIEAVLPALSPASADAAPDQARAVSLVRQLLAFSRRQARPAGYLSLNDAIRRADPMLRPIVGEAIDFRVSLGDVESVAGSEDDIEQLILEVVFAAAATLPYGGTLDLQTAPVTTDFVLGTQLTASAAGFGALSFVTSPSLARIIFRCGGVARTSGEAGRGNTLHIILPC